MTAEEKLAAIEAKLRKTADRTIATDDDDQEDFNPMDYSGGNFDDCYVMGQNAGEVEHARELLLEFFS